MSSYLTTTARDGSTKLHRSTCKKAKANLAGIETDDYEAGQPATCCKPRPIDAPAKAKKVPAAKAKQMATPKVDPAPEATPVVEQDPRKMEDAARAEWKAAKAAKKAGRKLPATPNLDELNRQHAAGTRAKDRKPKGPGRTKVEVAVRFMRGPEMDQLKPMPDSQNKLSSVAYYHTKGVAEWNTTNDSPRCTTDQLRAILTHHGIENVETEAWGPVLLPNGTWLAAEAL